MPTRTGYVFLGWHGRNLININAGFGFNEYVAYTLGQDNSVTVSNQSYSGDGTDRWDCANILIKDLTDSKYWLSVEDVEYSGECNNPGVIVTAWNYVKKTRDALGGINYKTTKLNCYFDVSNTENYYSNGLSEIKLELYISAGFYNNGYAAFERGSLYCKNIMLTKVSSENEYVAYEPYYIESDTVFGTPGDRTLTAMWSQDNILTGGALETESDLAQWEQLSTHDGTEGAFTDGVASIVTEDNYSCAKIEGQQHRAKQIHQSVLGKFEAKKMYSITAKVKLVNMIKHDNTATSSYFDPEIMLYSTGYVGSTWFNPINNCYISDYNNQGWVDVRFVGLSCPDAADDFDISQATSISFAIFIANYSGTLYIRDFAIAKM